MTGCGSAWLERLVWDQEVAGSNPVTPILIYARVAPVVEYRLAKARVAVRIRLALFYLTQNLVTARYPAFFCDGRR